MFARLHNLDIPEFELAEYAVWFGSLDTTPTPLVVPENWEPIPKSNYHFQPGIRQVLMLQLFELIIMYHPQWNF